MPSATGQSAFLDQCKQWEAALNPGQPGLDVQGKPLHVPACNPGGPTPFKEATQSTSAGNDPAPAGSTGSKV